MDPGVNKLLVETLQSVYGNLPQLVSKISVTKGISTNEALVYISNNLRNLTSLNYLANNVHDPQQNSKLADLESELRYLKEYYANRSNLLQRGTDIAKLEGQLARAKHQLTLTNRELTRCKKDLEISRLGESATHDRVGVDEELEDKLAQCVIERDRLLQEINHLMETCERQTSEYTQQTLTFEQTCRDNAKRIDTLNQQLQESISDNRKSASQIKGILNILNPNETDTDRVVELLNKFMIKYRKQERIIKELKELRANVENNISEYVKGLKEFTLCGNLSDSHFLQTIIDQLMKIGQSKEETSVRLTHVEQLNTYLSEQLKVSHEHLEDLKHRLDTLIAEKTAREPNKVTSSTQIETGELPSDEAVNNEIESLRARLQDAEHRIMTRENEVIDLVNELDQARTEVIERNSDAINMINHVPVPDKSAATLFDTLKGYLENMNVCLNTDQDVRNLVDKLVAYRDQLTKDNEYLAQLNQLQISNDGMKHMINQLNCELQQKDKIINALNTATREKIEVDPDILSIVAPVNDNPIPDKRTLPIWNRSGSYKRRRPKRSRLADASTDTLEYVKLPKMEENPNVGLIGTPPPESPTSSPTFSIPEIVVLNDDDDDDDGDIADNDETETEIVAENSTLPLLTSNEVAEVFDDFSVQGSVASEVVLDNRLPSPGIILQGGDEDVEEDPEL